MTNPIGQLETALAGRYEIVREIGQGGMATVYLARDLRHEREVAIKVLRPELSVSIGSDRFLREIKLAAKLQHPNILALYDSGEADGALFYVMPFVEGESLRDRMKREGQLPLVDAIRISCEVADALGYAHGHGVVHRDIKPENILLSGGHPLVADFGIARAVSSGGEKLTETGMAIGTPHYMSPEQALGDSHLDGRSDLYSLACVLYEMLIGQPPFDGPNSMAILARHSLEAVPSLQVVRHAVPDQVEDAIMQALEKTPADRFGSVKEFAEALAGADLGPGTRWSSARGIPVPRRTTPRGTAAVRRSGASSQPRLALRGLGGVALGAALLLGGIGAWKFWPRGESKETPALDPSADPHRIAVLYFDQEGGRDSAGYLADGLTEALIHELSQVKPLQVISRNGVTPYRNASVTPDSIARALRVGTLVEGTVRQSGDRLRVSVSLINAATGAEIGSKTLERPRSEIFALQDDLAKEVAIFLRQRLGEEIQVQESRVGTTSAAAWELLQRADELYKDVDRLIAAADTAAAGRRLATADSLFTQAEALDPKWARPSVQRAWLAYRQLDLVGNFDKSYYDEWLGRGIEASERALQRQPGDADALEVRGVLRYYRWIFNLAEPREADQVLAGAEADMRAAVAGNPNAAFAWTLLSHLLMGQSQPAEAKLAALRAYEADPYLVSAKQTVWRLFFSSMDLGDQQEAARWCAEGARRFPDYNRFTECQLWLFALKDTPPDVPKAWELLESYVKVTPPPQREYQHLYGQMLVAVALARAGLADSARAVAARSRGDGALDPTRELALLEAIARTLLGDRDDALRLLSTYYAANPQLRAGFAKDQSWWFESLRSDPRYQAIAGG